MKRKTRFLVGAILSLSIGVSCLHSFAAEKEALDEVYKREERRRIERVINSEDSSLWLGVVEENVPVESGISTVPFCADCLVLTRSKCLAEAILVDEGYHNTLLASIPTDCYAYYFNSHAVYECPECKKSVLDVSNAMHACWEIHKSCWLGDYDVCPCDVS